MINRWIDKDILFFYQRGQNLVQVIFNHVLDPIVNASIVSDHFIHNSLLSKFPLKLKKFGALPVLPEVITLSQ